MPALDGNIDPVRARHYEEAFTLTAELDQWRIGDLDLPGTDHTTPLAVQLEVATVQIKLADLHFRISQGERVYR